jgi:hypothetical protein
MEQRERWEMIRADLMRARGALSPTAASQRIRWFQEFLDHNELELACDILELYAYEHGANREFWLCLMEAAKKMELSSNAQRYEVRAKS